MGFLLWNNFTLTHKPEHVDKEDQTLFLLGICVMIALLWWVLDKRLWVCLRPVTRRIFGVQAPIKNKRLKRLLEEKVPFWFSKMIIHSTEWFLWVLFGLNHLGDNWQDMSTWSTYLSYQPPNNPEKKDITLAYCFYFTISVFTLFKDILKEDRKPGFDLGQFMFDLHHVLAVSLMSWSFCNGWWRCGFLSRLLHCPADFILFGSKIYQVWLETVTKERCYIDRGWRFWILAVLSIFVTILWAWSRCYLYGYYVYATHIMGREGGFVEWEVFVCWLMVYMQWALWILQVIWMYAISNFSHAILANREFED